MGSRKFSRTMSSSRRQAGCGAREAACVEFYGGWFAAFPDAHVDVHSLHVVDDVAVEEGTFTGTHDGVLKSPMGDVPPTGRPVRIAYIQVLRFRDGKHVSFNLMFDRLSMLEQLGLIPPPSPAAGETPSEGARSANWSSGAGTSGGCGGYCFTLRR